MLTQARDFPLAQLDSGQGSADIANRTSWAMEQGRPRARAFASLALLQSLTAGGAGWEAQAGRLAPSPYHSVCWAGPGTSSGHHLCRGLGHRPEGWTQREAATQAHLDHSRVTGTQNASRQCPRDPEGGVPGVCALDRAERQLRGAFYQVGKLRPRAPLMAELSGEQAAQESDLLCPG